MRAKYYVAKIVAKITANFCDKTPRGHKVLGRSKKQEKHNFLKKIFSVSSEKYLIFCFHICFTTSFSFYFLVLDTSFRTSAIVSFNIEIVIPRANLPLQNSFLKFDVALATLEDLLKMTVLNKRLNKTDMEKVG